MATEKIKQSAASSTPQWWVYIIETASGKLYTGITTDPDRRFSEHCDSGGRGAKFFRTDRALRIAYKEKAPSRGEASRREAEIKKMRRSAKLSLIGGCAGDSQ